MKFRTCRPLVLAPIAMAASLIFIPAAQAQPKSAPPPPVPIRGCITWLQMGNAQAKFIVRDLARIGRLQAEREKMISEERVRQLQELDLRLHEQRLTALERQLKTGQQNPPSSEPPTAVTPEPELARESLVDTASPKIASERLAIFDDEIKRIEAGLPGKRRKLAGIDGVYRRCIQKPPPASKNDEPAAPKTKRRG